MISILNYGMGNVGSIQNMLKKVGVPSRILTTADEIDEAQALIIPGVGHMDNAMQRLDSLGLRGALDDAATVRCIPVLGICLGMQMMTRGSEEGTRPGLGWVRAEATRFDRDGTGLRVPHMGWNVAHLRKQGPCFDGDGIAEHRFYFVHSYAVNCDDTADILTTTVYGSEFVSAFQCGNLTGVQFHPEKSHKFGESFFRRYCASVL